MFILASSEKIVFSQQELDLGAW